MTWPVVTLILVLAFQLEVFLLAWAILVKRPIMEKEQFLSMWQLAQRPPQPAPPPPKLSDTLIDMSEQPTMVKPPSEMSNEELAEHQRVAATES